MYAIRSYYEFATALQQGAQAPAALGLGDKVDQAFYTVGALPVLRVKLADEAAFDRFIQAAEARFQAKGETAALDGVSYRRYPFAIEGVITSYSIHYTKLYEATDTPQPSSTISAAKPLSLRPERRREAKKPGPTWMPMV